MNGAIAFVDLPSGRVHKAPVPESWRRLYLGGRGINMRLLVAGPEPGMLAGSGFEHLQGSSAWEAARPFILGVGLLTGMPCPSPSRLALSGPSPETGLLGDSNMGGRFAPAMRRAGCEHIVFLGTAPAPMVLLAEPGGLRLEPAEDIWGVDTLESENELKQRYGRFAQALTIGRAGENLARMACVRHGQKSAAGRGGLGCLMGEKRLKAVVVRGGRLPRPSSPEAMRALTKEFHQRLLATRTREALHTYGTAFLFDLHNYIGIVRTRNGRNSRFPEGRAIRAKAFARSFIGHRPCQGCRLACRHVYRFQDKQGREQENEGPEYGMLGNFGPVLGLADPQALLRLNHQLNDLGLDAASAGNIIAWAMELWEEGVITPVDTQGMELTWGDAACIEQLLEDMAAGRGFGGLLAKGALEASEIIGRGSRELLIWSKNSLQSDSVDVRAYKGFALGVATSTRGADHLRSRPTMEALHLEPERLQEMYGAPVSPEPNSYEGKARMVWLAEQEYALGDALGVCRFVQRFNSPDQLSPADLRRLAQTACNIQWPDEEFLQIGERITCLERVYLARRGIGREQDSLPPRYYQPLPDGGYAGERIDPERFQAMLEEYYTLHGWDVASGNPTRVCLQRLGLEPGLLDM